jgi:hypothetical protein
MRVEDEYTDVLQNIEFGVVKAYERCPGLSDYDVMHVLEALVDAYRGEKVGRPPRPKNLSEREQQLLRSMRGMCEWRLGRGPMSDQIFERTGEPIRPKTIDEIVLCLKRILKSVERWNSVGGRQGYLNFIVRYVE